MLCKQLSTEKDVAIKIVNGQKVIEMGKRKAVFREKDLLLEM